MAACLQRVSGLRAVLGRQILVPGLRSILSKDHLLQLPSGTSRLGQTFLPTIIARGMAGKREFLIQPSRFAWRRFKADFFLHILIGAIPLSLIVLYVNLFIGEAELAEIPEGYIPHEYEYYKHPISRFLITYFQTTQQRGYEQQLHIIANEVEKMKLTRRDNKIDALQAERMDYQGYLHSNASTARYVEWTRDAVDVYVEEQRNPVSPLKD